jgi:hypothetical protein
MREGVGAPERGPRPSRRAAIDQFCVTSHGAVMTVRPPNARAFGGLRALLPPGAAVARTRRGDVDADVRYDWSVRREADDTVRHHVHVHDPVDPTGEALASTPDAREAVERLASDIEYRAALHARARLFVHAAVVAWGGRAVLVPGRSFSGKSALAAALLRAGATYLSDEWAVLDEQGLASPFPRALRLRDPLGAALDAIPADRFGAPVATRPVPVALIVWTTYLPDARWDPTVMSAGETALALLDNAPAARRAPAFALPVIARTVRDAVGLRGPRGDADATAEAILRALDAPPARP